MFTRFVNWTLWVKVWRMRIMRLMTWLWGMMISGITYFGRVRLGRVRLGSTTFSTRKKLNSIKKVRLRHDLMVLKKSNLKILLFIL